MIDKDTVFRCFRALNDAGHIGWPALRAVANVLEPESAPAPSPPVPKVTPWTAEQGFQKVPPNTWIRHIPTNVQHVVSRYKSWSGGWSVRLANRASVTPEVLARDYQTLGGEPCGCIEV